MFDFKGPRRKATHAQSSSRQHSDAAPSEPAQMRRISQEILRKLRIQVPEHLPLLDPVTSLRSQKEVEDRLFALHLIVSTAWGFEREKAQALIRRDALEDALSHFEKGFLYEDIGSPLYFQAQVETLWALAWSLDLVKVMDFTAICDDEFVHQMPDLMSAETFDGWRAKASLRSVQEVMGQCDLAYCLHWVVRQSILDRRLPPAGLRDGVIAPRRRALEWITSDEDWDLVDLST